MATAKSQKPVEQSAKTTEPHRPKPPFPEQKLAAPGLEKDLEPKPQFAGAAYKPAQKLAGKVALITGGDSGIGRSVAVLYAREGADVAINYLPAEQPDAEETKRHVENIGRKCELLPGDLTNREFCQQLVESAIKKLGKLDILVSNAAHQNRKKTAEDISDEEWDKTFQTNVDALFFLCRSALPHLKRGSSIIVTSSETGLFGSKLLLDYSATKGAINAFAKALSQNLVEKGIRVNAVAPGPVWTPLNAADTGEPAKEVAKFGEKTPMGRPAQPEEIAPAYVFFASEADSGFITGHVLPILGGEVASG
jgi:NAD(P)-dependent dehydrogenase (short-subunit alcohol dehydrogenase family)